MSRDSGHSSIDLYGWVWYPVGVPDAVTANDVAETLSEGDGGRFGVE